MFPSLAKVAGGAAIPTTQRFVGFDSDGGSNTTYNFTISGNVDNKNCVIATAARGSSNDTTDSVVIAGQSCSLINDVIGGAVSTDNHLTFWVTDAPVSFSGSTTLSVTFSGNQGRCGACCYELSNEESTTPTDTNGILTGNPQSPSVTVQDGGCVISAATELSSQNASYDWTASDPPILEDFDDNSWGGRTLSGASGDFETGQFVNVVANSSNDSIPFSGSVAML